MVKKKNNYSWRKLEENESVTDTWLIFFKQKCKRNFILSDTKPGIYLDYWRQKALNAAPAFAFEWQQSTLHNL